MWVQEHRGRVWCIKIAKDDTQALGKTGGSSRFRLKSSNFFCVGKKHPRRFACSKGRWFVLSGLNRGYLLIRYIAFSVRFWSYFLKPAFVFLEASKTAGVTVTCLTIGCWCFFSQAVSASADGSCIIWDLFTLLGRQWEFWKNIAGIDLKHPNIWANHSDQPAEVTPKWWFSKGISPNNIPFLICPASILKGQNSPVELPRMITVNCRKCCEVVRLVTRHLVIEKHIQ